MLPPDFAMERATAILTAFEANPKANALWKHMAIENHFDLIEHIIRRVPHPSDVYDNRRRTK
jgi:hypothetical protein